MKLTLYKRVFSNKHNKATEKKLYDYFQTLTSGISAQLTVASLNIAYRAW